jgi:hypothetical protein
MSRTILAARLPAARVVATRAATALAALALLAACGGEPSAAADSALARDLALVQRSSGPPPIFRDTALTTAPARREVREPPPRVARAVARPREATTAAARPRESARRAPRRVAERPTRVIEVPPPEVDDRAPQPAPVAADRAEREGGWGAIGAGTVLAASSNARICTRSNLPGDRITATVNASVRGTNGAEIPAGSKVVLEIASINAGDPPETGEVVFRVASVDIRDESYPASGGATATGRLEQVQSGRSASSDRKKVIGGAIAGAILGQMMGKDTRSTVIGAAAGAAAGTAAAKMGGKSEGCLAAGTPLRITLDEAVVLH